jgi:cell division protein FtsB
MKYLKNKYVITLILFAIWMVFFDGNNVIYQIRLAKTIKQLKAQNNYYRKQTDLVKEELKELQTNPENLEKFAREKYLMKKDNEDVYVLLDSNSRLLDTINISPPKGF